MGKTTGIEYVDSTVNPMMGCTGCELFPDHCYAHVMCRRMRGRKGWPADFNRPEYFPGRLEQALRWSDLTDQERPDKPWLDYSPRTIFVNDLGDGFCPDADPEVWLTPHLKALEESPHNWLFLTKWPALMAGYFIQQYPKPFSMPENFILGTSVLRQENVGRIKPLASTMAFSIAVSLEPLLEPVDLSSILDFLGTTDAVIIGGESGRNARTMQTEWAETIVDQVVGKAMVFFKRWGDNPDDGHAGSWLNDKVYRRLFWPHSLL